MKKISFRTIPNNSILDGSIIPENIPVCTGVSTEGEYVVFQWSNYPCPVRLGTVPCDVLEFDVLEPSDVQGGGSSDMVTNLGSCQPRGKKKVFYAKSMIL